MLTDAKCRNARPRDKAYKLFDSHGLFLHVQPGGSKTWRYTFRFDKKPQLLTFGRYPAVGLKEARENRDAARALLDRGIDPRTKMRRPLPVTPRNTVEAVAREWWDNQREDWSDSHASSVILSLERDVFPSIGNFGVTNVKPPHIRDVLTFIQGRGAYEVARKVQQRLAAIFRYAVQAGYCEYNPAADMKDVIKKRKKRHMPALPIELMPEFLQKLDTANIYHTTRLAFLFLILTAARSGEVRGATWEEIDREKREWRIPAERMKMDRKHTVPLSRQAMEVLDEASKLSGDEGLIFPGVRQNSAMLSENTFGYCLNRLGYHGIATAHGFRAVFSTYANVSGLWNPDAVEKALAHGDEDEVRAAYNRGDYLEERRRLMQWWADELDRMRSE